MGQGNATRRKTPGRIWMPGYFSLVFNRLLVLLAFWLFGFLAFWLFGFLAQAAMTGSASRHLGCGQK